MYRDFQLSQSQKTQIQRSLERPRNLPKFNHNSMDLSENDRLRKIVSEEVQLEKKIFNLSEEKMHSLPQVSSGQKNFDELFQRTEDKNQFPNLKILTHLLPSNLQRQSIEIIMKTKPNLARSLDLYASGASKVRQKRNNNVYLRNNLKQWHFISAENETYPFQTSIDSELVQKEIEKLPRIRIPRPDLKLSEQKFTNISNLFGNQEYNPTAMKSNLLYLNTKSNRHAINDVLFPSKTMPKFNYYIGPGNNGDLIRRIMADRHKNWEEVSQQSMIIHFKWQQNQQGFNYEKMNGEGYYLRETLNQFEFHKEITSKIGLVRSLQRNFLNNTNQSFQMLPLAFIINFEERGWENDVQTFTQFYNANIPNKLKGQHNQQNLVLEFHKQKIYTSPYKFISPPLNEYDRTKLTSDFQLQHVLNNEDSYLWLLKPADWNRGEGVHVFKTLSQLEDLLIKYYNGWFSHGHENNDQKINEVQIQDGSPYKKKDKSSSSKESKKLSALNRGYFQKCRQFVIQKYIEKPFLIASRKFDIRCWVLMSQTMNYYLFQEGYIRTSSEVFDLKNVKKNIHQYSKENPFIHLTNNAVQKFSKNYGNFESGNQMSYDELQNYLDTIGSDFNFRQTALPIMKQYIQVTLQSARNIVFKFLDMILCQILISKYQYLQKSEQQPWLIEINTNPCIEESSPLLQMLLPRMIDDAFKITLDVIYGNLNTVTPNLSNPLAEENENQKENPDLQSELSAHNPNKIYQRFIKMQSQGNYPVHNYQDQKNMWEYLGSC